MFTLARDERLSGYLLLTDFKPLRIGANQSSLARRFPVGIHDDFSAAARLHERECFGEVLERKPVSNHLRQIDLPRLQNFRSLVPGTPQSTPEDPSDVCVFENDPVSHIELDVLRGQPE